MIALSTDCLLFQLSSGESIPLSAEMISVELMGEAAQSFEPEFVRNAAAAVFHYFRHDLKRETLSVGEFAEALERVLRDFGFNIHSVQETAATAARLDEDLRALARDSGDGRELVFFPRLRTALRSQLRQSPRMVRFHGLRSCVKQLAGAQRWGPRCENLQEQIVDYLRECLGAESHPERCSLFVE